MSYADYRIDKVSLIFAATILLYSVTSSVIAQNTTKEAYISHDKLKLSYSNVNYDVRIKNTFNSGQIKPFEKFNNQEKAGLRITPSNNQNLLFTYLSSDIKKSLITEIPTFDVNPEEKSLSQIAYYTAMPKPPTIDKKKWEAMVNSKYKNGLIKTVAPGVKHIVIKKYTKAGPLYVNVVEINPSINSNIKIKPALAGEKLAKKSRISNIVKQNDALIGINASFFKPSSGVPLGTMIIDKEIIAGPIFNRVVLGIKGKEFKMAKISINGSVITENGEQITVDNINQPRMLASYVLIYSDKWGRLAPPSPKYGIQVAIDDGIVSKVSNEQLSISTKGFVLVGPEKRLGKLKVGDKVNFKFTTEPDWSDIDHAVSGGPYLVKNGQVYIDAKEQKFGSITGLNPRTAVGYTKDNRLIMITIDGRRASSVGVSLYTLANIMKDLGCYNAMNFDGGSSTQMVVKNRVVNNPTSTGGNAVSNGLIIKIK